MVKQTNISVNTSSQVDFVKIDVIMLGIKKMKRILEFMRGSFFWPKNRKNHCFI